MDKKIASKVSVVKMKYRVSFWNGLVAESIEAKSYEEAEQKARKLLPTSVKEALIKEIQPIHNWLEDKTAAKEEMRQQVTLGDK